MPERLIFRTLSRIIVSYLQVGKSEKKEKNDLSSTRTVSAHRKVARGRGVRRGYVRQVRTLRLLRPLVRLSLRLRFRRACAYGGLGRRGDSRMGRSRTARDRTLRYVYAESDGAEQYRPELFAEPAPQAQGNEAPVLDETQAQETCKEVRKRTIPAPKETPRPRGVIKINKISGDACVLKLKRKRK